MEEVKLLGFWASSFVFTVKWALKLKGIEYDYIEEDLSNKSHLLLEYNPVHKKVPVLVHGGRPIAESIVILEYIEETWPHNPLLPQDPFDRAVARFWINFSVQKGGTFFSFYTAREGEKEAAAEEVLAVLKIIEDQCLGNKDYFGGDSINLVDIAFGWLSPWFECVQEVVGIKIFQPATLPRLHAWAKRFKEHPVIEENLPDTEELLGHNRRLRYKFTSKSSEHHV